MASVQTEAGLRSDSEIVLHLAHFLEIYTQPEDFALVMGFQRRNPRGWSSHFAVDPSSVLKNAHLFPYVCG